MAIPTQDYYKIVVTLFEESANSAFALQMEQYMKHQSKFYGIKAPDRRNIQKIIVSEYGYPTVEQLSDLLDLLWAHPRRELQHFGLDLVLSLIHI